MKMKLQYQRKLFSKATLSSLRNARKGVYTDKQLRSVLFKETKKQSLPLTPI